MGRRKNLPLFENVEITDIAAEGKSITKIDNRVVFVKNAAPGDVVDLQIIRKKSKFMIGVPVKIRQFAPDRVEPFCEHFGVCGGCKWQQIPYEKQLKFKEKQVKDNLERIGKVQSKAIHPVIPSVQTQYYRNKLEYTFSNKRWITSSEADTGAPIDDMNALGFHIPERFDKILDINHCYLQPEPSNKIRLAVKGYALKNGLSFFDLRNQEGFLRNLIIRTSISTKEVMVILSFFYDDVTEREKLLDYLTNLFPEITSLMYVINPKGNDTISDLEIQLYKGVGFITELMDGLKFKVGPKSFFQTNSEQALTLYRIVKRYADLTGNEIVYDFYTGTGTIASYLAADAKKVVGIEYISEAIEDARFNAAQNDIKNTVFYSGDIKDIFTSGLIEQHGKPDVLVMDPPRAGVHKDVIDRVLEILPKKIVYVSCNPATQARDIQLMSAYFDVLEVQPVDMFPHTHHIENVALLVKK